MSSVSCPLAVRPRAVPIRGARLCPSRAGVRRAAHQRACHDHELERAWYRAEVVRAPGVRARTRGRLQHGDGVFGEREPEVRTLSHRPPPRSVH